MPASLGKSKPPVQWVQKTWMNYNVHSMSDFMTRNLGSTSLLLNATLLFIDMKRDGSPLVVPTCANVPVPTTDGKHDARSSAGSTLNPFALYIETRQIFIYILQS